MSETPDVNKSAILQEAGASADSEFLHFYDNGAEGIRVVSQTPTDGPANTPEPGVHTQAGAENVAQMAAVMSFIKSATAKAKNPEEKLTPKEESRLNRVLALLAKGQMSPQAFALLAKISGKMKDIVLPANIQIAMTNLSKTTKGQMGAPAPKMKPTPAAKQKKTEDRYIKDGVQLDNTLKHVVGADAVHTAKSNSLDGKKPLNPHYKILALYIPPNMYADKPEPKASGTTNKDDAAAQQAAIMRRKAAQNHTLVAGLELKPY